MEALIHEPLLPTVGIWNVNEQDLQPLLISSQSIKRTRAVVVDRLLLLLGSSRPTAWLTYIPGMKHTLMADWPSHVFVDIVSFTQIFYPRKRPAKFSVSIAALFFACYCECSVLSFLRASSYNAATICGRCWRGSLRSSHCIVAQLQRSAALSRESWGEPHRVNNISSRWRSVVAYALVLDRCSQLRKQEE